MATEPVSIINSPKSPSSSTDNNSSSSPRLRRNPNPNPKTTLSAPWANIVRGESEQAPSPPPASPPPPPSAMVQPKDQIFDSDSSSAKISSASHSPDLSLPEDISDTSNTNAANKSKKPAWNKPSNVNAAAVEVSPLMGAVSSWPALSDSAKASPKSSSESLKVDVSAPPAQGPVVASPQKPSTNSNPSLNVYHQFPARQKSFKRGGGSSANGPQSPTVEIPQNNSSKPTPIVHGTSPRGAHHKGHNWEAGQRTGMVSQPHTGNDNQQQRNTFRRGGSGNHRGDGSNHYNHGNRREQDRSSHDSNPSHRVFNGRDGHMQQRVNQRNFVRPPMQQTTPFVSPPSIRPFGNPMGFPDMASPVYYFPTPSPESLRAVPFFHAAPFTMIVPAPAPAPDLQLRTLLAKQIEYYFSPENLCKDIYLRKFMDAQGWVPVSMIASFNRVKQLANNMQFILDSVRTSTVVEVQGDKMRKRNDWMNWTLQQDQATSASDSLTMATNHDILVNSMQKVGVEDGNIANGNGKSPADAHLQAVLSRSSSEVSNDQQKACNGEGQPKLQH